MNYFDPLFIRSAIQHGLLFNITPNVRFISVEIKDKKSFNLCIHFEKNPSEDEKEMMLDAMAEACGQFPLNLNLQMAKNAFFYWAPGTFQDLKHLTYIVYARYEPEFEDT